MQCTQNDYPQIPSLFVCIFLTTPLLFSLFPWVMSWVFFFFFLTPFYLCSLKYLLFFFFLFNCKTHPHITMYKICLNLWDPAKLSQPTTKKKEKRNLAPKPTKQGRKIVDLICGGRNQWVCCNFVLGLHCHRWQTSDGACNLWVYGSPLYRFGACNFLFDSLIFQSSEKKKEKNCNQT